MQSMMQKFFASLAFGTKQERLSALVIILFCCWGLGVNWIPAVGLAACWLLHAVETPDDRRIAIVYGIVAVALAANPHVGMLYGALVATIWLTTKNKALSSAPLALWIAEELPVDSGMLPMIPSLRIAIVVAALLAGFRFKAWPAIMMAGCGVVTIIDLTRSPRFDSIEEYKDIGSGYSPGASLRRTLGSTLPAASPGSAPIRGYLHGSKMDWKIPGLIMVEHDQWSGRAEEPIAEGNQQVDVPWHSNCWPGRQYLRHAIAKDGFVSSNLGGRLTDDGRVELCYWEHGEIKPVLVSRGRITWSSDSDYLNNALTIYNRWYVPELNRTGAYFTISRLANLVMACVIFIPTGAGAYLALMAALAVGTTALQGDVRISGGIGDAHDEGGASGVPDIINGKGMTALPGSFGAKVLVIPPRTWAFHHGEKTVVIGGGSTLISFSVGIIRAADVPLGESEGIVDARELRQDGKTYVGRLNAADGTVVIGTSSPGRLKWEQFYK
jgi:hypothetical protein